MLKMSLNAYWLTCSFIPHIGSQKRRYEYNYFQVENFSFIENKTLRVNKAKIPSKSVLSIIPSLEAQWSTHLEIMKTFIFFRLRSASKLITLSVLLVCLYELLAVWGICKFVSFQMNKHKAELILKILACVFILPLYSYVNSSVSPSWWGGISLVPHPSYNYC